jgi:hypothetical protein
MGNGCPIVEFFNSVSKNLITIAMIVTKYPPLHPNRRSVKRKKISNIHEI